MRLAKVQVREFKSVLDSNLFDVGDITCLVGKNEAGKTAILQALYRLNPIVGKDAQFDVTEDFPRLDVEDYQHDVAIGKRPEQTQAISATFVLSADEMAPAQAIFGSDVFSANEATLRSRLWRRAKSLLHRQRRRGGSTAGYRRRPSRQRRYGRCEAADIGRPSEGSDR